MLKLKTVPQLQIKSTAQFDVWITFLCHHMHELQTSKMICFLWPILCIGYTEGHFWSRLTLTYAVDLVSACCKIDLTTAILCAGCCYFQELLKSGV